MRFGYKSEESLLRSSREVSTPPKSRDEDREDRTASQRGRQESTSSGGWSALRRA